MPGHITSRKSSGNVLHEDLEIWPHLLVSNLTKLELGDDENIMDTHHQAVKEDRSPSLPNSIAPFAPFMNFSSQPTALA